MFISHETWYVIKITKQYCFVCYSLGSISNITIGGAISVATHGTGLNYGTLSSYVCEYIFLS